MDADSGQGAGLSLSFDVGNQILLAEGDPPPGAQPIDEVWLREHLSASGYGTLRYQPAAATALLASYNSGRPCRVAIAERIDAGLHIAITTDGLEARLSITPAEGGAPVTGGMVLSALADAGISEGVLNEAIDAAVAAGIAEGMAVARGLPPCHGQDGRLEPLMPDVRSRVPRLDESGHIDYRNLGDILVVHPDDPLMRRHPPTAGKNGRTLLGQPLPASPGKEVMFAASLPGTAVDAEDPGLLRATITGQPVVVRGGMIVEPVFSADTIDTGTGNINFDGSVRIKGDVSAGMSVRATGDIEIGGVVEMATLEAGGEIVIKGGAMGGLGRKSGGDHIIRCGGNLTAAYLQQARIDAGDSVFIDDMCMQSEVTAINHVCVGGKRRGNIVGGRVQATLSITAKVIGSPNRVRTLLEIGVNPLLHKQLLELAKDRDAKETQLLDISKLLDFGRKNPGKLKPEMVDKAIATAADLSAGIAALREEQDALTRKIELSQQSRVRIQQTVYDGVEVQIGIQRYRVQGEHGACAIGLGRNGLDMLPLEEDDQQVAG